MLFSRDLVKLPIHKTLNFMESKTTNFRTHIKLCSEQEKMLNCTMPLILWHVPHFNMPEIGMDLTIDEKPNMQSF